MPRGPSSPEPRRIDFHSHSYLTDGGSSPNDMWYAAQRLDHRALALTDHVSVEDPAPLLAKLRDQQGGWRSDAFTPVIGVELTMVPPRRIADAARAARRAGAEIVIVHGESIVEDVPAGTNHAAIDSGEVDVLAHPGLLEAEDADLAHAHGVALEISGRARHAFGNGRVARLALDAGAELVVDSDAHGEDQLIPAERARRIALAAGVPADRLDRVLRTAPEALLAKLRRG